MEVPDGVVASLEKPGWGHLFSSFHHSMLSIDKARDLLGVTPTIDFEEGHRATFEWFPASGLDRRRLTARRPALARQLGLRVGSAGGGRAAPAA